MTVYFTSDTHFGHKFVAELRGFSDVEEHNEQLVEKWNSVVGPEDEVYHLGDAVMGGFDKNSHYIGRLNGHKILIAGNHDRCFYGLKNYEDKAQKYLDAGFAEVEHGQPLGLVMPGVGTVTICHFPYDPDERHEERYGEYLPDDDGDWLLHGHVHELWRVKGRQLNVGVDVWDGFPISEDTVKAVIHHPEVHSRFVAWNANPDKLVKEGPGKF